MPDNNFDLQRGISPDNLLAVEIDSKERLDRLFEVNMSDFAIPKEASLDNILMYDRKRDNEITIENARELSGSSNPEIRKQAVDFIYRQKAKDPIVKSGAGFTNYVSAQEGQEKFTNSNMLNHNKYGFNPYITMAENEDFYKKNVWDNYSIGGKLWRGAGTFAGRVLSKLATGLVGTAGDIMSVAWNAPGEVASWATGEDNNYWAKVSNNYLSRTMEELDKSVKDYILPTYKSLDYEKKGAFAKLADPYFWQNEMADGVGFLLQFAVPAAGFGKLAQLGKLKGAGKLTQFMATPTGKVMSAISGGENRGAASAWIFNTTMESIAQTKEGFHKTVDDLMSKGFSKEEAEKEASNNAPAEFGMNMGILSLSSSFENRWFQKLAGNYTPVTKFAVNEAGEATVKKATTKLGKFLAENTQGQRLAYYGPSIGKSILMEGYWEENAQLAAARVASGSYTKKLEDNNEEFVRSKNFFLQLAKQTYDASTLFGGKGDKEAADSIMAGAVIGMIGGTAFSKLGTITNKDKDGKRTSQGMFEGVRRAEMRELAGKVAEMNNLRAAWLSMKTIDNDIYDKDANGKPILNQEKAKEKIDQLNAKLSTISSKYEEFTKIENIEDFNERKILHNNLFSDYVLANILNGTQESLLERLDNWKNKSPEELKLFGVTEDMNLDVNEMAQKARAMIDLHKTIENIRYKNPGESAFNFDEKTRTLKNTVYQHTIDADSYNELATYYKSKADELIPFDENEANYDYNVNQSRLLSLTNNLVNAVSPEEKLKLKGEIEKLTEELSIKKELLPDYEEDSKTGYLFKKGTKSEAAISKLGDKLNDYLINFNKSVEYNIASNKSKMFAGIYADPYKGVEYFNTQIEMNFDRVNKANQDIQNNETVATQEEAVKPVVTKVEDNKFEVKELDGTVTTVEAANIDEANEKAAEIVEEKEKIKSGEDLLDISKEVKEEETPETDAIRRLEEEKAEKIKLLEDEKAEILKELEFIQSNKPKDTLEQQKADIERRRKLAIDSIQVLSPDTTGDEFGNGLHYDLVIADVNGKEMSWNTQNEIPSGSNINEYIEQVVKKDISKIFDSELDSLETIEEVIAPEIKAEITTVLSDATEEEIEVVNEVFSENKVGDETVEEFIANSVVSELSNSVPEYKGEKSIIDKFRDFIRKVAKKLLGIFAGVTLFMGTSSMHIPETINLKNIQSVSIDFNNTQSISDGILQYHKEAYGQQSFVVVDKKTKKVQAFDKDGNKIYDKIAIIGFTKNSDTLINQNPKFYKDFSDNERITPSGSFTLSRRVDNVFGGQNMYVLKGTTRGNFNVAFHAAAGQRIPSLLSPSTNDNNVTFGCISIPKNDMKELSQTLGEESHIYVIPDSGNREIYGKFLSAKKIDKSLTFESFLQNINKPEQKTDSESKLPSILAAFGLLGFIKKKRDNGEEITDEDIQKLKDRLKEIDNEVESINKEYATKINEVREKYTKEREEKTKKPNYSDETVDENVDVTDKITDVYSEENNKYKPILWGSPLHTSKYDSYNVNDEGKRVSNNTASKAEVLRDIPYNNVVRAFISEIIPTLTEESGYKFFIENDTYTNIYQKPFNNENEENFVPSGEVVTVYKDGKPVKVSDVFPNSFADMANLPIVVSFNKTKFSEDESKISLYMKNTKSSREEVIALFKKDEESADKARKLAKQGKKVEVHISHYSTGSIPSVQKDEKLVYEKVIDRIGDDFKFKISKEGIVYANFGKNKGEIPISMPKLKDLPETLINIDGILNKVFETEEEAKNVRTQYLNILFNTNKKSKFSVYPVEGGYKIVYREIKSDLEDDQIAESEILPSKNYENLYINVSKKALSEGYNVYEFGDGSFTFLDSNDYIEFLKDNAKTHFKKITDKEGNLKMFPINMYFSFEIVGLEDMSKENVAKNAENRINSLIAANKLDEKKVQDIQIGLQDMLAKNEISETEYKKLNSIVTDWVAKDFNTTFTEEIEKSKEQDIESEQKEAEKIEPKKPQTLAEKKKALLNKNVNNIKEVLVTPTPSNFTVNDLKEITIDMEGQKYTLDLESGNITRLGISGKVKINPDTTKYGKILLNLAESKPFSKVGGFVDGIFVQDVEVEKDGNNVIYKALGLPSLNMTEVFLDENGGITDKEFTKNLTENGKKQFENFENRYC